MENEYSRSERVSLSGFTTGSSARVIDGSELDPAVRRRKDAEAARSASQYMEKMCNRYRDRGIADRLHAAVAKQEKQEALSRAMAPEAYAMTDKLDADNKSNAYRSGVSNGKPYMTMEDFARCYHEQRDGRTIERRPITSVTPVVSEMQKNGGQLRSKKAGWLADTDKLPVIVQKLMKHRFFQALNEWAGETFPREQEVVNAPKTERRAIPVGLVASLVTVAVSMSLVIGSTVLVSQSTQELSELKEEIGRQEEILDVLNDELAFKNDALGIDERAREELGMVPEKYLSAEYMDNDAEDHIEIHDDAFSKFKNGLSALLSAFGIGD